MHLTHKFIFKTVFKILQYNFLCINQTYDILLSLIPLHLKIKVFLTSLKHRCTKILLEFFFYKEKIIF